MLARPRFKTPQEREQYYRWKVRAGILLAVILFGVIIFQTGHEKHLALKEKRLALDDYQHDYVMRREIENRHKQCFEYNYSRRTKFHPEFFDRQGYRQCLNMEFEQWLAEKRKQKAGQNEIYKQIQEVMN
ncbi:Uncharacterized protein dnl_61640 [Desulfonema limicola]|uniref:Uncharacterized protein n=1 Tax=Desulfonema limicola TaxID=45656 RepID=A0A975BDP0_9BACT|nr:hypothetical protein [Desulfonema limicola]QTA83749.1 Uncharacterized protein dnl_61640 [Desulfonema limicola]